MMHICYYGLLLAAIFVRVHATLLAPSPCAAATMCKDCHSWCKSFKSWCRKTTYMKLWCRETCDTCNSASVCHEAGCAHFCDTDPDEIIATCSCFEGYRLETDGKTCSDIDECSENSEICKNSAVPFCTNTRGSYWCASCDYLSLHQYYGNAKKCCLPNYTSKCGIRRDISNRLMGFITKITDTVNYWTWTAYIVGLANDNICGGSLISTEWVLTAAHCFKGVTDQQLQQVIVVLGIYKPLPKYSTKDFQQKFKVEELIRHRDHSEFDYDIALIRLNKPVITVLNIRPVCLPNGENPKEGNSCYVLGHGKLYDKSDESKLLKDTELVIPNSLTCHKSSGKNFNFNPATMMCAEQKNKSESCPVDSGGPVVCQRAVSCDWYIAGVTSIGRRQSSAGNVYVFTSVEHVEDWISQKTGISITKKVAKRRVWSEWSHWTICSATCGGGTTSRERSCMYGDPNEPDCYGNPIHRKQCNTQTCVNASVTP